MFFKRIETDGLAHYSYLIGDGGKAFVIDPMRDVQIYLDIAAEEGLKITDIFESHRNEDYIIGSIELADKTGANIHISKYEDLGYTYGDEIGEGDSFDFGKLRLEALHTPGHTLGHMSYVLYENDREEAYMVFTGDCLFMGDLGRTDFYGEENLDKMTGLLYDSIFEKLFPLGDSVLVMPAHGVGSACGETMEDRPYTTIGYERKYNPNLQVSSKEEFIEEFAKMRIKPRYFEKMEVCNVEGAPFLGCEGPVNPIAYNEIDEDDVIIDLRSASAYIASHIPGSTYIGPANLASLLGNFFDTESSLIFIAENDDQDILEEAYLDAKRTGFENIKGYLKGNIFDYSISGGDIDNLEYISAKDFNEIEDKLVLDVRGVDSLDEIGRDGKSYHIPAQVIHENYQILPEAEKIYILCGSGDRATSAASYLKNLGYNPVVVLGGALAISNL